MSRQLHQQETQRLLASYPPVWNLELTPGPGPHPIDSTYVEVRWLQVLGPSALWLARRLALTASAVGTPTTVEIAKVARAIGLGAGTGYSSPIVKTAARLVVFRVASVIPGGLSVPASLPDLPEYHVKRIAALDGRETIPT